MNRLHRLPQRLPSFAALTLLLLGLPALAQTYRISGVVTSARNGTPVPFCRVMAAPSPGMNPRPALPVSPPGLTAAPPAGARQAPGVLRQAPRARTRDTASEAREVKADASGKFVLDVPHGGNWHLSASARDFRPQDFDGHEGFFAGVVLSDEAPAYFAAFRLVPDSLIEGIVVDEWGDPVRAAQVVAEKIVPPVAGAAEAAAGRTAQAGNAMTDDRGHYELAALPPGNYRVRLEQRLPWYAQGGRFGRLTLQRNTAGVPPAAPPEPSLDVVFPTTWSPGTDDEAAADIIALKPGEARQADIHVSAIPAIHLRVPRTDLAGNAEIPGDTVANGVRVRQNRPAMINRLSASGASFSTGVSLGPDGQWDFGGLTTGVYEVTLPAGSDEEGEVRRVEIRPGSSPILSLEHGKPVSHVTILLDGAEDRQIPLVEFVEVETGIRIHSNVPSRGPRGPVAVHATGLSDDPEAPAPPRVAQLPAGKYRVTIAGSNAFYLAGVSARGAEVDGRIVVIHDGSPTVVLHVANGRGDVSGRVMAEARGVEGALVMLVPATLGQVGNFAEIARDESNSDGSFEMAGVVPGRYILVAIDRGWDLDLHDPETLAGYLAQGTPLELRAAGQLRQDVTAAPR